MYDEHQAPKTLATTPLNTIPTVAGIVVCQELRKLVQQNSCNKWITATITLWLHHLKLVHIWHKTNIQQYCYPRMEVHAEQHGPMCWGSCTHMIWLSVLCPPEVPLPHAWGPTTSGFSNTTGRHRVFAHIHHHKGVANLARSVLTMRTASFALPPQAPLRAPPPRHTLISSSTWGALVPTNFAHQQFIKIFVWPIRSTFACLYIISVGLQLFFSFPPPT